MRSILIILLSSISLIGYSQQGKNFSMWYQNRVNYNSSYAGKSDNDMRIFANFRYQYFSVSLKPYQSFALSGDFKLFRSHTRKGYFGFAPSFVNDMSGDGRYMVNDIMLPISYHIFFDNEQTLSVGISPGIYFRSINPSRLTWETQWNGIEFDPSITPEPLGQRLRASFNLGSGVAYTYQQDFTKKLYVGLAVNHILQQNLGFNEKDKLHLRFTLDFGMRWKFDGFKFGISPHALAMVQGPNMSFVYGLNFDYYLKDASQRTLFNTATLFSFGVYHRYGDAFIANLQFEFRGITIALAYDSNINSMMKYSKSVGAVEVGVSADLIFNKKTKFLY